VRFLFVHQNFPGQFLHIVRHLVDAGEHEVLFIGEPSQNQIPGVRVVPYLRPTLDVAETHASARELDNGMRRAEAVFRAAWGLRHLGYEPDIIIGHHGWGEMLNLPDVWPNAPILGYFEFFYRHDGGDVGFDPEFPADVFDFGRIRAKNALNLLALNLGQQGQSPTHWQKSTYPAWARPQINLLWEGVNTDLCSPDPTARRRALTIGGMTIKPTDKLVTYVSRDLEPYRGFHSMMRALPHLLRARPDLKVVMIGGNGVSYGGAPASGLTWKETLLREVGDRIDLNRVVFPGRVSYDTYRAVVRRSDAHVYLTYPFVASWSLREALAMGAPVLGSDTVSVREFITDGQNGLLVPFLEPQRIAERILALLEDRHLTGTLRAAARAYAEKHLLMKDYLDSYTGLIERMTGQNPVAPAKRAASASGDGPAKTKSVGRRTTAMAAEPTPGSGGKPPRRDAQAGREKIAAKAPAGGQKASKQQSRAVSPRSAGTAGAASPTPKRSRGKAAVER
jgi:hypothetical protein